MKTLALNMFTGLFMLTLMIMQPVAADPPASKRPLFFYVFIHDDIATEDRGDLHKTYFQWLRKDLESFTGRRVQLQFIEHSAPWTNFSYKGEDLDKTLAQWTELASQYRDEHNQPVNALGKYLLLTQSKLNSSAASATSIDHYAGIASTTFYTAAAHVTGHMLGGTHEAAEVLYKGGWWCETNLVALRNPLRANCYVYSDKNKEQIAAQLNQWP